MKPPRALVGAWLVLGLLGCAEARDAEQTGAKLSAIVQGEPSGTDQDGVVLLRAVLAEGEVLCSASLVAPNLIVTARHCVSYLSEGVFNCSVRGEAIDNPDGGGRLGLHLPADSLEVYAGAPPRKAPLAHGQQVISTLSPTICKNDLAFVVLDTALDLPIVPLRLGSSAQAGEHAVLVGYGLSRDGQSIDYHTQKRAKKANLEILQVGPDSLADGVTTVAPRSIVLEGPSGCVGDSGGPLLAQSTGALLGVYSLLEGESCEASDVRHHLVHVPPFTELIDEAFAAVDAQPRLEPSSRNDAGAGGVAGNDGAEAPPSAAGGAAGGAATDEPDEPATPQPKHNGCSLGGPPRAAGLFALLAVLSLLASRRRQRAL